MNASTERAVSAPQLALPVGLADEATLENFLVRPAIAALYAAADIGEQSDADDEAITYLHGAAEGGKSHLLQAVCHRRPASVYLPLATLRDMDAAAVLDGLERSALIALDGLDDLAGSDAWEEALFHLVNRARAASCPLWFAARRPPAELGLRLADLRSRLTGGVVWAVPAPPETDKLDILRFRARRRGLELPDAVASYIASRGSRSLTDLLSGLARLDVASLQLKRPLTIPLVREVMGWR